LNGREALADTALSVTDPAAVAAGLSEPVNGPSVAEGPAFAEPAMSHDIGQDGGLSDIAQGALAPAHPLHGYIDEIKPTGIKGWAWDPQMPSERIRLELVEGEARLRTAIADEDRPGLILSGIGDGRHGFSIALDPALLSEGIHILHLRSADTRAEVPGSPIMLQGTAEPAARTDDATGQLVLPEIAAEEPDAVPEPAGALIGGSLRSNIDYADWGGIKGWIWDPTAPDETVTLELLDGDNVLATVVAGGYRPDLIEAGIGDGRHGFTIGFTETLLPFAWHVLHLRPVGSTAELPSFPMVLTRDHVGFDPSVMRFLLGNVTAETARAQEPDDLAPMITNLVEVLDQALLQYYALAADKAALAMADVLNPADLSPQVQTLVESIQRNYPPIHIEETGRPIVSIIIPVYNKFELTYQCVKSIQEQGARIPYEIIIVDDCSRDETILASFAFTGGVRLVRNTTNLSFVRTCNRGFEVARGEYVVFLNNDTQVKPFWLDELYETMRRDDKIGIAGSKLLYPDGRLQECGGIIWRMGDGWNWGRDQDPDDPRFCYMRDSDYVSGAALMIKSSLFKELGKFDEYYVPLYYEDTDLCFKVRKLGYRTVVQPASEVIHFEGASAGTSVTGTGVKRFQAVNHRKFFDRWKDTLSAHRFNGEMPELEAERSVRQRALVIDDSVPEPDKDAGSNAAFQHILTLQRLGYKVTFIPGDNMAKIEPYTTELQRRGVECLYHPYYFSVEDVFRKQPVPFDLVYLHRYSNASKYGGMVRQHFPKARILYSVADLHFLRLQRHAEVEDDPVLRQKAEQMRRLELGAMFFVDCVIVHSAAEAELLAKLAPGINVQVIPWTVEPRDIVKSEVERPAIAFVGGYRHEPNIDAAKWAAQGLMPSLRQKVPGIELLLVGSHMTAEVSALAEKDVVPLGYVPSLDNVFERVRLTIAPLRYGAGLKGKVLESLAAGIPCVMTTVAAEGLDLPKALQSLVVDEPNEIAARVAKLCRDNAEYRRIVDASKAYVSANYSAQRIDALLKQACALGT
jgi:GT2 family glycosyltransferase/glycosyltransferase involved in cell wall biosynthesis